MNWIKKCPVFVLLAISGLLLTVAGMAGKNSIYASYPYTLTATPYLALVMNGVNDGLFPWDAPAFEQIQQTSGNLWNQMASQDVETILNGKGNRQTDKELYQKLGIEKGEEQPSLLQNPLQTSETEELPSLNDIADIPMESADTQESLQSQETPAETPAPDITYSFQTAQEEYFQDALFIGDSRTVGMSEYGAMPEGTEFFCKTSLTIYEALTKPVVFGEEGKKITLEEVLMKKQYGKIYLMLGINELGTGDVERFIGQYKSVVDRIIELQPDTVIFVQGIMNVTGEKSANDKIFNNVNIGLRNTEIEKLSDNKQIFYLDINSVVNDENGDLNADNTFDGIHLKAPYYKVWKQYLMDHAIVR